MTHTEYVFKVIVIGQPSTGKTSYIKRYVHELFSNRYKATIGVDFALKTLEYDENTIVRLQLWDIAGQERFQSLSRAYYRDAVGAFLVLSVNEPRLESILMYKNGLDSQVSLSDGSTIPCLLLANKCDLIGDEQKLKEESKRLKLFAKENGFIDCIMTSSKLNINVDSAARVLVAEILRRQENLNYEQDAGGQIEGSIRITSAHKSTSAPRQEKNPSSSCCR